MLHWIVVKDTSKMDDELNSKYNYDIMFVYTLWYSSFYHCRKWEEHVLHVGGVPGCRPLCAFMSKHL